MDKWRSGDFSKQTRCIPLEVFVSKNRTYGDRKILILDLVKAMSYKHFKILRTGAYQKAVTVPMGKKTKYLCTCIVFNYMYLNYIKV